MITKSEAIASTYRQNFYGISYRDKLRVITARVNGTCKVWQSRPEEYRLPMKYGLKECFYIDHDNAYRWFATEAAAKAYLDAMYAAKT